MTKAKSKFKHFLIGLITMIVVPFIFIYCLLEDCYIDLKELYNKIAEIGGYK